VVLWLAKDVHPFRETRAVMEHLTRTSFLAGRTFPAEQARRICGAMENPLPTQARSPGCLAEIVSVF